MTRYGCGKMATPTLFQIHPMQPKSYYPYTPYYCEENIWQLVNREGEAGSKVMFISNRSRQCALWNQKIGEPGAPVIWDYHVVYLFVEKDRWRVIDFDTLLPWGLPLNSYLLQTFDTSIEESFMPNFRLVPALEFLHLFRSDRRHMRDRNGDWIQPVPDWPIINGESGHNLHQFIDMDHPVPGVVISLETLRQLPLPE